jgi:hypothetical protein
MTVNPMGADQDYDAFLREWTPASKAQLVGLNEQRLRYDQPERLRSFEIDDELELGRLQDRQVRGERPQQPSLQRRDERPRQPSPLRRGERPQQPSLLRRGERPRRPSLLQRDGPPRRPSLLRRGERPRRRSR